MTRKRTRFRFSFPESEHDDFVDVDDASPFDEAVSDSPSGAVSETSRSAITSSRTRLSHWWADESAHAGARVTEWLGEHLIAAVLVGGERTLLQDAAFGMRQLVDIALKTLSPAINDRTLQ
jgi:hypothetical protein